MIYLFDTREKKNDHIKRYFDRNGIEYRTQKLDYGDYMLEGGLISVDRKQNLSELSTNLMNRSDKARFWREIRGARQNGIRLIVLCEHGKGIKSIEDVATWRSEYSPVTGRALMEEIFRCHMSYGVEFLFCQKRETPKKIIELLAVNR